MPAARVALPIRRVGDAPLPPPRNTGSRGQRATPARERHMAPGLGEGQAPRTPVKRSHPKTGRNGNNPLFSPVLASEIWVNRASLPAGCPRTKPSPIYRNNISVTMPGRSGEEHEKNGRPRTGRHAAGFMGEPGSQASIEAPYNGTLWPRLGAKTQF